MFQYEFIRTALIVGVLLAIIIPLIGTNVVFKRLSMTGDALSHTSLAGVAIGLLFGYNPIIVAMITSVVAALAIELTRKKFHKYAELSTAVVMSGGIGIAAVLSSHVPNANFNTYLFGNIFTISPTEKIITIILFVVIITFAVLFYKELMYTSYNERSAKLSGVPVAFVNIAFTVLTALTVAIASRTVGALIVSSLMVVPIATSLQITKSYKSTILYAVLFSVISMIGGIVISTYLEVAASGATVLLTITILILIMIVKGIKQIATKPQTK